MVKGNNTQCDIHVSSTEPARLREIGHSDTLSEEYGCDILLVNPEGKRLGIQRKSFPSDLTNSMNDNRIAKQVDLMRGLDVGIFMFEGVPLWSEGGELMNAPNRGRRGKGRSTWSTHTADFGRINRQTVESVIMTLAQAGYSTIWADDMTDLMRQVCGISKWWAKTDHTLLTLKPAKVGSTRQARTQAAFQVVPGVGVKAARLLAKKATLKINLNEDELSMIPGLGPKTVTAIVNQFGGSR